MTREEAIKYLVQPIVNSADVGKEKQKELDAYNMAIKALEQLPKLQNRCFALTQGQICMFCPYDCENRTAAKREVEK